MFAGSRPDFTLAQTANHGLHGARDAPPDAHDAPRGAHGAPRGPLLQTNP